MKPLIGCLFVLTAMFPAGSQPTFTGTVTDDVCGKGDHSQMRMGSSDGECAIACVGAHGAAYVLYDGKATYLLSDQPTAEQFAGKKVTVTGTLDAKTRTIRVSTMRAAR